MDPTNERANTDRYNTERYNNCNYWIIGATFIMIHHTHLWVFLTMEPSHRKKINPDMKTSQSHFQLIENHRVTRNLSPPPFL